MVTKPVLEFKTIPVPFVKVSINRLFELIFIRPISVIIKPFELDVETEPVKTAFLDESKDKATALLQSMSNVLVALLYAIPPIELSSGSPNIKNPSVSFAVIIFIPALPPAV